MIAIQVILILGFIAFLFRVVANPSSYQLSAWTKIFASFFVIMAILAVIFPDTTNTIAHWVGVNRGADLLLYLLTLAFIFAMLSSYVHGKRIEKKLVLLARKIAIIEANTREKHTK